MFNMKWKNFLSLFLISILFMAVKIQSIVTLDNQFKSTCDSKNFKKYLDKYIKNIETGEYDSSLWKFPTFSVI